MSTSCIIFTNLRRSSSVLNQRKKRNKSMQLTQLTQRPKRKYKSSFCVNDFSFVSSVALLSLLALHLTETSRRLMGCLHDPANFQQMYSKYTC